METSIDHGVATSAVELKKSPISSPEFRYRYHHANKALFREGKDTQKFRNMGRLFYARNSLFIE